MKFSENTLSILKNFASINSGIVLNKGNIQRTLSGDRCIFVEAEIDDALPSQFCIYDLNQFLGNISVLNEPELDFTEKHVIMSDDVVTLTYRATPVNMVIAAPDKSIVIKQVDVTFNISDVTLQKILRIASLNEFTHFSFIGKDGEIRLRGHIKASDTSNDAMIKLCDYHGEDFVAELKPSNAMRIMPGDYKIEIQLGAFVKFTNLSGVFKDKLKYFIAVEAK